MPIAPPRPPDPPPSLFLVESYLDTDKSVGHWKDVGLRDEWWVPMERLAYFRARREGLVPLATLYDLQKLGTWLEENGGGGVPPLPENQIFVGNAENLAVATPKPLVPISDWGPAKKTVFMGTTTSLNYISNLKNPVLQQDAATKGYVDSIAGGAESIRLNELSLWGRPGTAPPAQDVGTSVFPAFGPILSVPVAFNKNNPPGTNRQMGFQRSFFYGRITVNNRTNKTFELRHDIGTRDFLVMVRTTSANPELVYPGIYFPSDNILRIGFKFPPGAAPPGESTPLPTLPVVFTVLAVGLEYMVPSGEWQSDYYVEATGS